MAKRQVNYYLVELRNEREGKQNVLNFRIGVLMTPGGRSELYLGTDEIRLPDWVQHWMLEVDFWARVGSRTLPAEVVDRSEDGAVLTIKLVAD